MYYPSVRVLRIYKKSSDTFLYKFNESVLLKALLNLFYKKHGKNFFSKKFVRKLFRHFQNFSEKLPTGNFPENFSGKMWETFPTDVP